MYLLCWRLSLLSYHTVSEQPASCRRWTNRMSQLITPVAQVHTMRRMYVPACLRHRLIRIFRSPRLMSRLPCLAVLCSWAWCTARRVGFHGGWLVENKDKPRPKCCMGCWWGRNICMCHLVALVYSTPGSLIDFLLRLKNLFLLKPVFNFPVTIACR